MSKGLKSVLAVAAAIAIPYAAPALFTALATSAGVGTLSTFATVAGSALTGSVLGAASSKLLGGNVKQGALLGAIGGGAGAYFGLGNTAAAKPLASTAQYTGPVQYGQPGMLAGTGMPTAAGSQFPSSFAATQPTMAGTSGALGATTGAGLSGTFGYPTSGIDMTRPDPFGAFTPSGASSAFTTTGGGNIGTTFGGPVTTGGGSASISSPMPSAGLSVPASAPTGAVTPGAGYLPPDLRFTGGVTTPSATPLTFTEAIKQVPGQLAAKFRDPQVLADMTLRAGAQIAGSALAGSGLSPEEQQLLDQQTEELRALKTSNEELFRQRLQAAQDMIGESRYFDPEFFGLQSARRTQTAAARASAAGTRGMTGERRRAEERRYALASGRDVGTAYDAGYSTGVQGRLQTRQAGLSALPSPLTYTTTAGVGLLGQEYARQRRREAEEGFGRLAAPLYT